MGKQCFERLLSFLTNQQRAAEMTGDLLEQHPTAVPFWWAASRVLFAFTWRPVIGITLAFLTMFWEGLPFAHGWFAAGAPLPMHGWQWLPMNASYFGLFAWPAVILAAVRFSTRSPTAALGFGLAACSTFVSCSLPVSRLNFLGLAGFGAIVVAALIRREHRNRLGTLFLSAFTIWLVTEFTFEAKSRLLRGANYQAEHMWRLDAAVMLLAWLAAMILGWMALRPAQRQDDRISWSRNAQA